MGWEFELGDMLAKLVKKYVHETLDSVEPTKKGSAPYEVLTDLEIKLRNCIGKSLEKIDANWWKSRVPADVRENAEKRMNIQSKNVGRSEPFNPIDFVDFPDYLRIIIRKDNWKSTFKEIFFNDEQIAYAKLKELEPLRNNLAHGRALTDREVDKLDFLASELSSCMARNSDSDLVREENS